MYKSICVYCGSSSGNSPSFASSTIELGRFLASQKIKLVYGGGGNGLMGLLAETVLKEGGSVLGVLPRPFLKVVQVQKDTDFVTTIYTEDMHERKQLFLQHSDAFIALAGGFGTFEELLECITWRQLGIHQKPIIVFDPEDFYAPMKEMFKKAQTAGFISRTDLVIFCKTVEEVRVALNEDGKEAKGLNLDWKPILSSSKDI